MDFVVEMRNICKSFPGVTANRDVSLGILPGEIHALVGENGAGKTTLMNILYGLHHPDSGEIIVQGKNVKINRPSDAIKLGIGMVHQHFMLVPSLTVLENIILGREHTRFGLTNYSKSEEEVKKIAEKYNLNVNLSAKVYELSVGEMQRVEILKSIYRGARLLILDEPTAVLIPQETQQLFEILRNLTSQGCSIVFISHKLKEVLQISNRITVMRGGKVTGLVNTQDTDETELACLMVGRKVVFRVQKEKATPGDVVVDIKGLDTKNDRGLPALKNINFNIRQGEILGVAGVEGNGQAELVEVITGLRDADRGEIIFQGENIVKGSPRKRRELGISHIPSDRLLMGVNTKCSISDNLILNKYYREPLSKKGFFIPRKIKEFVKKLVSEYGIATPDTGISAGSLSGGNMQKLVLARELEDEPRLLVAAQPTRGVDVGAIEYIHSQIIKMRDKGNAVLLVSAELDEILSLADRIVVMYEGEITAEFKETNIPEFEIGLYMAGSKRMNFETCDHAQSSGE